MREAIKRHTISFKHATEGLLWAVRSQPNFRVHMVLSVIAIAISLYFRITRVEWSIILFTIVLGLSSELINTAIEAMTDLITKEWKAEAKIAKDVSAGMMLTVALGAIFVALFIFFPYIQALIRS